MERKICIIHFNTPILTRCLVQSINKYTPNAKIYIFDNSNKDPFINYFDNVTVFDNTKGEILNFNEILKNYPERVKSRGKTNNYGSAKHSMSIQKCIELIDDEFVLLDSDVLLKRNIVSVWDNKYVWVAGVEDWQNKTLVGAKRRKRVCPFLLYMNVPKMKELGITFFDDKHMLGFNNGPKCEEYETGVWMYEATPRDKRKIINYNDFIYHFRAGSWLEDAKTKQHYKQIDPLKWLERHKDNWLKPGEAMPKDWNKKHVREETVFNQRKTNTELFKNVFDHIYYLVNLSDVNAIKKFRDEIKRVGIDETDKNFSWSYIYPSNLLDLVYNNRRLNMNVALKASGREYLKRYSVKHYEVIKEAYSLGYNRILILENDVRFHNDLGYINSMLENIPDTDVIMLDKMTSSSNNDAIKYKSHPEMPIKTLNKAMKKIIELQEGNLLPADTPLNDKTLSGSFAIENVAIKNPKLNVNPSEDYGKIGLDISKYSEDVADLQKKAGLANPARKVRNTGRVTSPRRIQISSARATHDKMEPRRIILPDKAKRVVTRRLPVKVSGHNKLYDVY